MDGIGVVLAGGGSKGAYQIGVWKALIELDVIKNVGAYSGTSIGALNAGLFVQGDIDRAEHLWLSITREKLMTKKISEHLEMTRLTQRLKDFKININFENLSIIEKVKSLGKDFDLQNANLISKFKNFPHQSPNVDLSLLSERIKNINLHGIYSREGIKQMMIESADFTYIGNSDIHWFAACLEIPNFKIKYFKLNKLDNDEIEKILLASSAIPIVYDPVIIKSKTYVDGGASRLGDNVPVKPIYDLGYKKIIVVHLRHNSIIDERLFPGVKILQIRPTQDIGNFLSGIVDFSVEGVKRRIECGYNDTMRLKQQFIELDFID